MTEPWNPSLCNYTPSLCKSGGHCLSQIGCAEPAQARGDCFVLYFSQGNLEQYTGPCCVCFEGPLLQFSVCFQIKLPPRVLCFVSKCSFSRSLQKAATCSQFLMKSNSRTGSIAMFWNLLRIQPLFGLDILLYGLEPWFSTLDFH